MRRWPVGPLVLVLFLGLFAGLARPAPALADDIALQKIMRNGAYGGIVGAMLGGAILAFVHKPSDHLDFITTGAAAGVLVGVAWGVYDSNTTNPYVMLDHGKVRTSFSAPTVMKGAPSVADAARRETVVAARLVGVRF